MLWVSLPRALVCVRSSAWCVGGLLLLVPASLGWGLRLLFVRVWLVCVVGGASQLLAEGPGCGSPPLLAGIRRLSWWLVPRHSWLRVLVAVPRLSWLGAAARGGLWSLATPGRGPWVQFPVIPGWGPPFVVLAGPSPPLAEGFGCGALPLLAGVRRRGWSVIPRHSRPRAVGAVPRHSWLGSAGVCWWGFARHSWLRAPGAAPCLPFLAGACLWRWCGGVVRVCWCALLWLAAPALLCGPGVCVCVVWRLVLVWVRCGVGLCVVGLRSVCVCVPSVCGFYGMSYLVWSALSADMVTIKGRKGSPVNV